MSATDLLPAIRFLQITVVGWTRVVRVCVIKLTIRRGRRGDF